MVRRATAKSGDCIIVSGTIGDAALGVLLRREPHLARKWSLSDAMSEHLETRYLLPEPRVALSEAVLGHASAAMDVSDGLAADLAKLCRTSGLRGEIDIARVPLSDAARAAVAADAAALETVLTGGDDYEILLAIAPERLANFGAAAAAAGVAVTEIGRLGAGQGAHFMRGGEELRFARPGYSHFY